MPFIALEKLIKLHDDYRAEFQLGNQDLLLLQVDGERYLTEARCPHQDHPLLEARLEDGCLECPLHDYRFSLRDGRVLHPGPEHCRALRLWPVAYEGTEVGVDWESAVE